VLLLIANAFATPSLEEIATSPELFAVCKAADVISTAYVIEHGIGVEANPIVTPLIAHGYIPLILVSYGMYRLIKWLNNPGATLGANVATCAAAVNNLLLIP
jgi:hypothetical protein